MKGSLTIIVGIVAGIINCVAWYALSRHFTYYDVVSVDTYRQAITVSLIIVGVFLVVFFKRKENNGFLQFKEGFKTGILYALLLGLCLAVFNYIYYKFIAPDAIEYYLSEQKKLLMATIKVKPEDLPKFEEMVRSAFSSFKMLMQTVLIGVIISLIAAGIIQKKAPALPFSEN
jgi:drug/metabolite transporter (DMT)-like permease